MNDDAPTPEPSPEPPPAARPQPRRWKRRLLAAGFGAALALFAVEVVVRVLWSQLAHPHESALVEGLDLERALFDETLGGSPAELLRAEADDPQTQEGGQAYRFYRADPRRGFRLAPNASTTDRVTDDQPLTYRITTDAHGLRGPVREAEPGALKVLLVGDSMTFGKGVDDDQTFASFLEPLLTEQLGRPVRVLNAGVSSYGQIEELATIEELTQSDLQPDVVLLAFTVANDLTDNFRWKLGTEPLERDEEAAAEFEHLVLDNPLAWWSRTYRLLAWRWGRHLVRYRLMSGTGFLDRAGELLAKAQQAAGERPFGVVIVPPQFAVQGYWAEPFLRIDAIRAGLDQRLEAAGIPHHDPLEALQAHADDELYIPGDLHFTVAGHRVFAEAIAPFVAELAAKE